MKYINYLNYIFRHKFYVAQECFKRGLYWRGIIHDWSKFLPDEFFPYAESFYGIGKYSDEFEVSYVKTFLAETGKVIPFNKTKLGVRQAFNKSWMLHQRRNKHHHQYWVLREDSGNVFAIEMPVKYATEMVCDWIGAGKAINGKNDVVSWYEKNKDKMILHENTRKFVEFLIYNDSR